MEDIIASVVTIIIITVTNICKIILINRKIAILIVVRKIITTFMKNIIIFIPLVVRVKKVTALIAIITIVIVIL